MATPGAIGVYLDTGEPPPSVTGRPWRGTTVHLDGYPDALGAALLDRVQAAAGDLDRVVRELIDAAPHGWRVLDEPYGEDDAAEPVGHDHGLGAVAWCFVIDRSARRIDAFATHGEARGERIRSVSIAADGTASGPFVDPTPPRPAASWWRRLFGG